MKTILLLALAAAVTTSLPVRAEAQAAGTDWRRVATASDRERLRKWRQAWVAGLNKARAAGAGAAIAAQGPLLEPDRALAGAVPPPGRYRCRIFKLGAANSMARDFAAFPAEECRVDREGDVVSLYRTAGAQRPVGLIFADLPSRAVFLGTMVFGDEARAIDYGRDSRRDMAGLVERVGDRRWRVVLPYPKFESVLDVIELTPDG